MSDEETIKALIQKAREDLQHATHVLDSTPRPPWAFGM